MRQRMEKKGMVAFLTVALLLGGAWLAWERLTPTTELKNASAQRMEQMAGEIEAEAAARTELVMAEIDARLEEQGTPEYGPVYREIFLLYEAAAVSMELGAAYVPPEELFLDSYAMPVAGEALYEELEAEVEAQLAGLTVHYTTVDGARADQFRCILYPAIRAQLELERGLSLSDPLEQAVEESLEREMNEVVKPQLLLQGKLDHGDAFRDVIYDQVRHRVYKDHGVDLNEFA